MMWKIAKYQMRDVVRSRWPLYYGLFLLVVTDVFFRFTGTGDRVVLSLMNVVLLVVPMMASVMGAMFMYGSREYVEMILSQPIRRGHLFVGFYGGLTLPLVLALVVGISTPFALHAAADSLVPLLILVGSGAVLTAAFVAIAFLLALGTDDRIRGLGLVLAAWLFFAVLYNGLILVVIRTFADRPIEGVVLTMSLLNPVDLGRILLLLNLDASALMGYTGALFARFVGSAGGQALAMAALLGWILIPLALGHRTFRRKNF